MGCYARTCVHLREIRQLPRPIQLVGSVIGRKQWLSKCAERSTMPVRGRRDERRREKRKTLRGETAVTDSVRQVPGASKGSKGSQVLRSDERSAGFDYVRDDHRRRIRVTVHANMTRKDWLAIIDRQASEGTWS